MNKIAVCIISGGMDSALSAKIAEKEGMRSLLSF